MGMGMEKEQRWTEEAMIFEMLRFLISLEFIQAAIMSPITDFMST